MLNGYTWPLRGVYMLSLIKCYLRHIYVKLLYKSLPDIYTHIALFVSEYSELFPSDVN